MARNEGHARPTGTVRARKTPADHDAEVERTSRNLQGGHLHITARLEDDGRVTARISGVVPYDTATGERTATSAIELPEQRLGPLQKTLQRLLDRYAEQAARVARHGAAQAMLADDPGVFTPDFDDDDDEDEED
jgi:hypothetical protein